ncbi:MAG: maleylpyruvate isomerase family mycothiol-dependent enzyme [Actinobacteria bacterium]|nr:maleylpyruvate isomerase family mycothiol-dependent enzyme [Actinomycetota bacterium]
MACRPDRVVDPYSASVCRVRSAAVTLFDMIAGQRRELSDLFAALPEGQLRSQSLCSGWTVHDIAAHLAMELETRPSQLIRAMLASRGDTNRAIFALTARHTSRSTAELAEVLRRRADDRRTLPGTGPEAPLTDLVVHGLDVRVPLGLHAEVPADQARVVLDFLTTTPARGFVPKGRLAGLRFEATDLGWARGTGALVRGPVVALVLAITGRGAGLADLTGDGVPVLRERIS